MIRIIIFHIYLFQILQGSPTLSSWVTEPTGRYARVFPNHEAVMEKTPATTWSKGEGVQELPAYAGITEISFTSTKIYIRTSSLGFHVMGPWSSNDQDFSTNYPINQSKIFELPRFPEIPLSKTETPAGAIGYMVDGVPLFGAHDTYSYDTSEGVDDGPFQSINVKGDGFWNRDAYITGRHTFDSALAHQEGTTYHYHTASPAIRHLLGDSVSYDAETNHYTEAENDTHSPIIGWGNDGLPLYGPYGYSDPNDTKSGIRRMISGYQLRDGSNTSTNLPKTGRTTYPQWIIRNHVSLGETPAGFDGPAVSTNFPIGHYVEDYAYKGDLGLTLGVDFDLSEYNARFCITPDFPNGTWAYFSTIEASGTPVYPYTISRYFYGNPLGGPRDTVPSEAEILFEGGPKKPISNVSLNKTNSNNFTIKWSGIEGGRYSIDSSPTAKENSWTRTVTGAKPTGEVLPISEPNHTSPAPRKFYRTLLTGFAPFDQTGIQNFSTVFPLNSSPHTLETVSIGNLFTPIIAYDQTNGILEVNMDSSSLPPGYYPVFLNGEPISTENYFNAPHPDTLLYHDWTFDPDTSDKNLGEAQTGQIWAANGSGHLRTRVLEGKFTQIPGIIGGAVYAWPGGAEGLSNAPDYYAWVTSFDQQENPSGFATSAFLISPGHGLGASNPNILHIVYGPNAFIVQLFPTGTPTGRIDLCSLNFSSSINDGASHLFQLEFTGENRLKITLPVSFTVDIKSASSVETTGNSAIVSYPALDDYRGNKHPAWEWIVPESPNYIPGTQWVYASKTKPTRFKFSNKR